MIKGVHTMFYSSRAEELRAFLKDKLGLPFTDVGQGWLIFDLPEADMGVHPADDSQPHSKAGTHDISFYCDDVRRTMSDLQAKGVEFTADIADFGYGLVTYFKMPGGVVVQLYQPHYVKRRQATRKAAASKKPPTRKKPVTKKKAPPKKAAPKKKMANRTIRKPR